jgi:circadian clock protein KaiC
VAIHKLLDQFKPSAVIVDPISNLSMNTDALETQAMLLRLVDLLKSRQITAMFVDLASGSAAKEATDVRVSSIIDTWLLLRTLENDHEREKYLYVMKSRGMPHSKSMRKFEITATGIQIQSAAALQTRRREGVE